MKFIRDLEDGFVLVMSLIILPVFLAFGLILIDIGRGNNAQADLQTVVDALALTGARELDGSTNAMTNAQNAMTELRNPVSMLSFTGTTTQAVSYTNGDTRFDVIFLTDIPADDRTPIDVAWTTANTATTGEEAEYVYVRAYDRNTFSLRLIFSGLSLFSGDNAVPGTLPIGAIAVAKSSSTICDIPPLYICNPFEFDNSVPPVYVGDQLQTEFAEGNLHGRLFRLHPPGSSTQAPGNFGYLSINGSSSADAIRDLFAGDENHSCYESGRVRTKPGAANNIEQGFNVRFDMYGGPYANWNNSTKPFEIHPAANVRKGSKPNLNSSGAIRNECVGGNPHPAEIYDDHIWDPTDGWNPNGVNDNVFGFPDNTTMLPPNQGVAGAYVGSNGNWDTLTYLSGNYPDVGISFTQAWIDANITSTFAHKSKPPSRYDVYTYENANNWEAERSPGDLVGGNNTGELGTPQCGPAESPPLTATADPDPRVMVAAIIDCTTEGDGGGVNYIPVNSFASIFLTRPMYKYGPSSDMTIDVEIIDITGFGGNGTLETFQRDEAILVR